MKLSGWSAKAAAAETCRDSAQKPTGSCLTAAIGAEKGTAGRPSNSGHDGGDVDGDQVSGQQELAPQGDSRKTMCEAPTAISATAAVSVVVV